MLPGGTDGAYRAALAGPHEPTVRVEVWRQGVRLDNLPAGLPIFGGAISATLNSQVTRQLSLTIDESFYPAEPTDLLAPYGNELRVFQGVRAGAAPPYEWQTFRGRINEVSLDTAGTLTVSALDRAADVKDSGFFRPENAQNGNLLSEFKRLVIDAVPDAQFGTSDKFFVATPLTTWQEDRGSACDELAGTGGAYWYTLANGDFVMRTVPWTIDQTAVLTLSDGPGGTLFTAVPTRSRENVFNVVIVTAESTDGGIPLYALVADNDAASPTYVGGAFGVKSKLISSPMSSNQQAVLKLAQALLLQSTSLTQTWNVSCPPDPSLELGDAIIISARNLAPVIQVVSGFTLPMAPGAMSITFRALQPGLVEE